MKKTLRGEATLALLVAGLSWALPPDAPIAEAAMRGDIEAVRTLVKQGADVNAAMGDGMTALHWAAEHGNAEMAELLIYAGAGVNALTRLGGYAPVHLASRGGHASVVRALLAAGANPDAVTGTGGVSALHFAASAGDVESIEALVDKGADVNRAETQWGHTPLMFAAARNRADAIHALVKRGADVAKPGRVIDMVERQKLDQEQLRAKEERLGLARGTFNSQNARVGGAAPSRNPQAQAAAQAAAAMPKPETPPAAPGKPAAPAAAAGSVAERAQARGTQAYFGSRAMSVPEQIGGYGGLTALTMAVRDGNVAAALALLEEGADVNAPTAGDGTTPLLIATINGHFDLAVTLLERGADPNRASNAGETPLFATIQAQWAPMARFPMPSDHLRQKTTYLDMMEALLRKGADVGTRLRYNVWHIELGSNQLGMDWIGATPFFRAAHAADVEAMKLLVRYGADPTIPTLKPAQSPRGPPGGGGVPAPDANAVSDPSGIPPVPAGGPGVYPIHAATGYEHGYGLVGNVHRTVKDGWLSAVRYLVEELGADVNMRDFRGDTPLHNAAARGDNAVILYLVSKGADVTALNRKGQTTADMANGPTQRIEPFPETIKLLESLGSRNNHNCVSC
jgi:ankyrin repeat protein